MKISVLFNCRGRLELTELILRRFLELMTYPFELVLAYDGNNKEYIDHLNSFCHFDHVVTNENHREHRHKILNKAQILCDGDYYMFLENDFYWDNPDAISNAIIALETIPEVDLVRMEIIPWHEEQMRKIIPVGTDRLGILKLPPEGPRYQFVLNPHLRRDKMPVKGGYLSPLAGKGFEMTIVEAWLRENKTSGCLLGENFRHLGLWNTGSRFKKNYIPRFTLQRRRRVTEPFNPIKEFAMFCDNKYYQELFRRYLDNNN